MNLYLAVLFAHIVATLGFFFGLGTEWLMVRVLRKATSAAEARIWIALWPKLFGLTVASAVLLVGSGVWLAARTTLWSQGWIQVTWVSLLLIAPLSALGGRQMRAIRSSITTGKNEFAVLRRRANSMALSLSISCRMAVSLGIVMLMTTKPNLIESVVALAVAASVGLVHGIATRNGNLAASEMNTYREAK